MNIPDTSGDVWDNWFADTRGTELELDDIPEFDPSNDDE